MSEHKWDRAGERCEKCGDKDWMGGPCNAMSETEAGKKTFWTSAGVIYASDKDGRMGRVAPSRQEIKTK